ncbi:MAG TPA: hypothetical protein VFZ59_20315 [Verrucomicrobiae bacterium]|nr:hypothetical protein [Verrucomicrobiae bacterium]
MEILGIKNCSREHLSDDIGQLKTAKGWESDTTTPRLNEQFGYAYDKAWNLERRTKNALVHCLASNNLHPVRYGRDKA